ncbi:spermidine/putrescine ABC transporter substrate-binding protein [Spirulina major CS-329]|uniref:polyamine ABC transporter substrate-binding protein n=1 Tax=Spirulina TaxID=1154 RepID=UPI00232D1C62|nr:MULTISPECIES: spermidine/putrescine ABC transporter substrate-binding protein [Spirulina]MDB9495707.1 spermidine/putrescine ABC transporter substrate-binding protein [Spirulina subsalsa CS-330]MDB9504348.1 spermidine/putrescine ABC transporter substrate-binding protein [Spirulina major CS-329]
MKRLLVFVLLFLFGVTMPIGCAANSPDAADSGSAGNGASENVLSIYNWSTYIDPDVITQFEKDFDATVQYDTYESNDALFAKIQPGNPGYDIIVPTGDFVESMAAEGLLEELNHDNIPNLKNVDPLFLDQDFDPGNQYSVPYQWGTIGIGYDIEATGEEITRWQQIFDPKYAGKVSLMEDSRATLGAVLMALGKDPNTTDPAELQRAVDYIVEHKEVIATFAPDTGQDLLNQGEVAIAVEWSGDIFQVMEENENIRYVIPEEGTIVWVDNMAIPKDAPNKALAEQFINFVLEPEIGAKISAYVQFGSPNKAAVDQGLIPAEDLENSGIYPAAATFARLQYAEDLEADTQLYDDAWTELKVAVGE